MRSACLRRRKANFLVNKPHMVLNSVQNVLTSSWMAVSFRVFVCVPTQDYPPTETRHLLEFFLSQPRFFAGPAACAPFFSVVVEFLTSPEASYPQLCYRAIFMWNYTVPVDALRKEFRRILNLTLVGQKGMRAARSATLPNTPCRSEP